MDGKVWHAAAAGFEAARRLEGVPEGHRARNLHGHGFQVRVRGALPSGWADFPGGEVQRLQAQLGEVVAALDHHLLNEVLEEPSDERLARWIGAELGLPLEVGVQSMPTRGVDLDGAGRAHVWRRYAFQSAHRLPNVPEGHKCGRMHGHGFEALIHAQGVSHDQLDALWAPLQSLLHHACLNELPGLENPTSEMLSSWIWRELQPTLPGLAHVTVFETASCGACFDGRGWRTWKEFTLDSALRLKRAPADSLHARLHGHTYTLRLHLAAPLDELMGWTLDFGDVKRLFDPVFRSLDHQPLHEIDGLADCDTATLARWVLAQARERLPQVDRVDLYETPGCGATLHLGTDTPALPI
ncbi:6-carboxytetrahydropterin synthase [Azohydromonas caseinilytica]|uniref:6-carboxy-5,6,7,8-tetrahydropterin synthase n=1 Tax=Azohydromonas caseinilytica TaxID=2728836 RepID=A0A848F6D7_9BURK|nr:6-carboxytetrahydropterin synthase [Azohydromonas caseinilytica]NML14255.1 6-pyruvoyl tetrahydropterin synthase [Azohydromonas caseinilytica]